MDNAAISLNNLSKSFQGAVAVDHVTLQIGKGELFGLLGPNGAGKSTLIKMLTTMLRPSNGTASIFGHDIVQETDAVRSHIGVVFQDATLDGKLTGRENLDFHAQLYGLDRDDRHERVKEVLDLVGLRDKADMMVEKYSGGMQRRLAIARGLINHPQVLFLDEPTLGLDAQTRRHIWEYIKELNVRKEMTILLTTHYMEEADRLCERLAIIDRGRIVALDTPEQLKGFAGADIIDMQVQSGSKSLQEALTDFPWIFSSELFDGLLVLHVDDAPSRIPRIIIEAERNNAIVTSVSFEKPTLEDIFLRLTGRDMREGEATGDPIGKRRWQRGG